MTALPTDRMPVPLTAAAYAALPEEGENRFELQEGALVMVPRTAPVHQERMAELPVQLRTQSPSQLKAVSEVDVDLQLVPADGPGTVRAPDVVVVTRTAYERVRSRGGIFVAGEFGYADAAPVTGAFSATDPFPLTLDLDKLV